MRREWYISLTAVIFNSDRFMSCAMPIFCMGSLTGISGPIALSAVGLNPDKMLQSDKMIRPWRGANKECKNRPALPDYKRVEFASDMVSRTLRIFKSLFVTCMALTRSIR
jgi:hypothetical protein